MRTLLVGDLIAAARAGLAVSAKCRVGLIDRLICEAAAAHLFHKRLSKTHPHWGNGSLMARANLEPQVAEPFASDADYLLALRLVIERILASKSILSDNNHQFCKSCATRCRPSSKSTLLPPPTPSLI